jgi:hypothetical protein
VPEQTEKFRAAIMEMYGCDADYSRTVDVVERFGGETVWAGEVYVFQLKDHPALP